MFTCPRMSISKPFLRVDPDAAAALGAWVQGRADPTQQHLQSGARGVDPLAQQHLDFPPIAAAATMRPEPQGVDPDTPQSH